jgi:hypothetical protein
MAIKGPAMMDTLYILKRCWPDQALSEEADELFEADILKTGQCALLGLAARR